MLKPWLVGTLQSFQKNNLIMFVLNINASEISNGDDAIAGVCNEYNPEQVPDTKHGKY